MRNHLQILEDIDNLLAENGFVNERKQLDFEISASATGGELCLRCGSKLLTLQSTSSQLTLVMGHLIKEFISYCHTNGLYPKPNY
jgi:succinylarginine dihydrolase